MAVVSLCTWYSIFSIQLYSIQWHQILTVKETIIDDGNSGIWTFDQLQGVVNVNVPVRMTVVKVNIIMSAS